MTNIKLLPAYRANYSTPFGERWLTVHAPDERIAGMLAENKVMCGLYKKGWSFNKVEKVEKKNARY